MTTRSHYAKPHRRRGIAFCGRRRQVDDGLAQAAKDIATYKEKPHPNGWRRIEIRRTAK